MAPVHYGSKSGSGQDSRTKEPEPCSALSRAARWHPVGGSHSDGLSVLYLLGELREDREKRRPTVGSERRKMAPLVEGGVEVVLVG